MEQFVNCQRFDQLERIEPGITADPSNRRGFIGGTDIQHILNIEPYGCARSLYYQKTGAEQDREFRTNAAIIAGKRMEDSIADDVAATTGWKIRRRGTVAKDHKGARIDREIVGHPKGPGVLEIKTVSDRAYWTWKTDGIPTAYLLQLQWYLHVLDRSWGAIAAFNRDTEQLSIYEFEANDDLQAAVAQKSAQFWLDVVHRYIPPALPERDNRCESCQWEYTCRMQEWGKVGDYGLLQIEGLSVLAGEYEAAKEYERRSVEIQKELRTGAADATHEWRRLGIERLMGDNERAALPSGTLSYKVQKSTRVDVDALKMNFPEVYAQVLKKSVARVLRTHKNKGEKK